MSFYLKDCVSGVYQLGTENLINEYRKLVFPFYIIKIACVFLIIKTAKKGCIIKWSFKLTPHFTVLLFTDKEFYSFLYILPEKQKNLCSFACMFPFMLTTYHVNCFNHIIFYKDVF